MTHGWSHHPQPAPQPATSLAPLKIVVGALAWGLVMMMLPMSFILSRDFEVAESGPEVALPLVLPLVTALAGWLMVRRPSRLSAPPERAHGQALAALRTRTLIAAAITESGGVLTVMLAFVFRLPMPLVLGGLLLCAVLVLLVAWPSAGRLRTWEQELHSQGHRNLRLTQR
ncbi:hypothetical protein HJ590_17620 [Naumannella sp. ID2617S]|uniref:Uncharacterized protein n=1 Tax=Enemella dayhoffiae TaxID=2016507 RepID=A0A255GS04_9ACTN|nr:hypothetical protein [Enemella dayhoffiae]NNG21340.1 hypothetical protein [Naumannella sp. ID2617S]OYO18351.1 hypothetical protein CGZ93_15275 [Enemella dayhoffiae]